MTRNTLLLLICCLCLLFMSEFVIAPTNPHNVKGRVFHSDGVTGVENGIPVRIDDTNLSTIVLTYVNAPDVPSLRGSYSTALDANDNDLIAVTSWNSTHYGENTAYLAKTTTTVNVILNTRRPSETNVTIQSLTNSSRYNVSELREVTAHVQVIGGESGVSCSATLSISNSSVLTFSGDSATHDLNNIALGAAVNTSWNVSGIDEGSTSFTVNASCSSDGLNFQGLNSSTVTNITLIDITPPNITILYPNNSINVSVTKNPLNFTFTVSDESEIANCSLHVNASVNGTNSSIQRDILQYFYDNLSVGDYSWHIECFDNSSARNNGSSEAYALKIVDNGIPVVKDMVVVSPVNLNPGTTTLISCNATVQDNDLITDISVVNATYYHSTSTPDAFDDDNYHYTNTSCLELSSSAYEASYSCSFTLQYYANAGEWTCNITAVDQANATGSSTITSTVNDLLALDISPSVLDFGSLQVTNTSADDVNLTITNLGNKDINISVNGYGVTEGDGVAMVCQKNDIPVGYQRYATLPEQDYSAMQNLTKNSTKITGFTIPQRTNDLIQENDQDELYWKLSIPLSVLGPCNGTIVMLAVSE